MPFLTDFIPQATIIPLNGNLGLGVTVPNERLTVFGNISASGNVYASKIGINTSSPDDAFQILGGANNNLNFGARVDSSSFGNHPNLRFIRTGGTLTTPVPTNSFLGAVSFDGITSANTLVTLSRIESHLSGTPTVGSLASYLTFNTSTGGTIAERMRVHANGNIGIGTASPGTLLTVAGNIEATGMIFGTSTRAANLTGGAAGQIPYQSAANTTLFSLAGTSGQILQSNGTNAPSWLNQASLSAGNTSWTRNVIGDNSGGGVAGAIVYQSAANTTAFTAAGSNGQLLRSNGANAPTWENASVLNVNSAVTLATSRTLWGQSFNGSANVTGNLTDVGTITFGTQANKATLTYTANTARTYTIPDVAASDFVMTQGNQTIAGTKTFSSTIGGSINGNSATATNLAGNSAGGQILYQSGNNTTSFLAAGTSGQFLRSGGTSGPVWADVPLPTTYGTSGQLLQSGGNLVAPTWVNQNTIIAGSANSATHLAGGLVGQIPYQSSANTTAFLTNLAGNNGQFLRSNGAAAPSWASVPLPDSSTNLQLNSLGIGTAASNVTGEIRALGNITAYYSDERLKEVIGPITDALGKVNSLNSFYFKENDKAKALGYKGDKVRVGISAQAVQKILPEIVTRAPIDIAVDENGNEYSKSGEEYLTVGYSDLVPLLIGAINELTKKVSDLESKLSAS